MLRTVRVLRVPPRTFMSRFSTKGNAPYEDYHEGHQKFKLKQQHFQQPDGKPIFLKGGPMDKVLFLTTLGLCGVGLLSAFTFILTRAFPKKPVVMPLPEPIIEEIEEEPEVPQSFFSKIWNFFRPAS